ncbi:hypothetical protein [Bosea sp. UC22_33]|uniref:hypothetical protein n=1 Tax=Bosea sp. UC22_33 TaxID=3350165 RepID=UPI00366BF9AC
MEELGKSVMAAVGSDPVWADMGLYMEGLNNELDRGAVLISSSYLEGRLGELLKRFLVAGTDSKALVDDFNAPFGTFSARIKGTHALGIISDTERDRLDWIRRIRNEFAHNLKANFSEQRISSLVKNMKPFDVQGKEIVMPLKMQFTVAAAQLVVSFNHRIGIVEQSRLKPVNWPAGS